MDAVSVEMVRDYLSRYGTIGERSYGGTGSAEEHILAGYFYAILSGYGKIDWEFKSENYAVYLYDERYYIVFFDYSDTLTSDFTNDYFYGTLFPVAISGPYFYEEVLGKLNPV
ncbi:MAG: hypothetical protein ACP5UV_03520 [Thermoplasmata archaeon]